MKTLKSIFFLCLMSCILCIKINAQIVYTDVNPDTLLNGAPETYHLDLNNDGVTDFDLTHGYSIFHFSSGTLCAWYYYTHSCYAYPKNQDAIASDAIGGLSLNSTLDINGGLSWRDTSFANSGSNSLASYKYTSAKHCPPPTIPATTITSGNWFNQNDKYLGLKIIKNGLTYFGWVRLQMVNASSITIKDYAYNSVPNQPILAGETSCTTPTVNLTQSGSLSFCAGDSVTLTANGTGYQYQWKKNNINISGATAKTYAAKTAGVYKCKVTNSCGNKTSGTRTVTVPCRMTNDNFVESLERLSIYPNPATNSVTIKFPSDKAGEISIVNLFGQTVYSEKINAEQTSIDVRRFSAGMYSVRWRSGENNETRRFSVIK